MRSRAIVLLLAGWFLFFTWDGLRVHFAPDDMMNIDSFYWTPGPWRLLISQILLWRGYYRPMGGLFYLPVLAGWGLNPLPYHVLLLAILLLNVWLVYRLAVRLGADWPAALLAALAACYHAGLSNLYYNTAFVYDVLCGCFYFAALVYYGRVRAGGRAPTWRQMGILALLITAALNSKEMALTLPAAILAFEWCYHRPLGRIAWKSTALSSLLVLVDLYGKIRGVDALTGMEGYRPVFTLDRIIDYQRTFFRDAAFLQVGWVGIAVLWMASGYLAWRPGARPVLRFCWLFVLFSGLPIEFLPGKSQACLYIPAMALAIFVAVLLVDAVRAASTFLAREPILLRVNAQVIAAVILLLFVYDWGRVNRYRKITDAKPVMQALGLPTAAVIDQFRALHPQVSHGSHVVFLNDPFQEWDMLFIADLWFRDRSITVHLQRKNPLPPDALAAIPYWFDYRDGRLTRIK